METEQAYGSSLGANDSPSCLPFHCPAGALLRTEKIPYHTEVIIKNKKAYKNILESKAARNKERRKIVPASFSHRFLLLWSHYSNLFRQEKKGSAKPISIFMWSPWNRLSKVIAWKRSFFFLPFLLFPFFILMVYYLNISFLFYEMLSISLSMASFSSALQAIIDFFVLIPPCFLTKNLARLDIL